MLMISELMPDQHTKPGIQLLYYIFLSYTTRTYIVLTIFFARPFESFSLNLKRCWGVIELQLYIYD